MAPKKVTPRGKAATPKQPAAAKKKTAAAAKPKKKTDSTKFVRNIRNITVRATLDNDRRIELKPRGQRGDLASLAKDEVNDSRVIENIGMIWEVISAAEAQEILHKQATNQQVTPTALDHMLNEYGQPYQQEVKLEEAFEQQGETVATLEEDGDGRFVQNRTSIVRGAPEVVSPPGAQGNPVTEGQLDQMAREGDGENLRDALNVNIEPTQKG